MGDAGWDPYVEASGTLWLLHWWLLRQMTMAPVWWITFNSFPAVHFSESALDRFALEAIGEAPGWTDVIASSVKKDVDCLIRMYAPKRSDQPIDDLIDCPFRELRLIESVPGESRTYRFVFGPKPGLPDAIVAYAALDFMARTEAAATMSVARLTEDIGSPGRAFRLGEAGVFDALSRVAASTHLIKVAEPAGLKQVLVDHEPAIVALQLLDNYFRAATGTSYRVMRKGSANHVAPTGTSRRADLRSSRLTLRSGKGIASPYGQSRDPIEQALLMSRRRTASPK
jgi:hypothetical protein